MVFDEEGRRLPNQPITWNVDLGTIVSSDSVTNIVGEAYLVVQSPTTSDTANISVTCEGITKYTYLEYATPATPSVRILTPTQNESVSGVVEISVSATDTDGSYPGIATMGVAVDGQPLMPLTVPNPQGPWQTYELPNGTHQIKVAALDFDGECGFSATLTLNVTNTASSICCDNPILDTSSPETSTSTISATLATPSSWSVIISEPESETALRTFTGTGTSVNATWDGKDTSGVDVPAGTYTYSIESGGLPITAAGVVCVWRTGSGPTALLVDGASFVRQGAEQYHTRCLKNVTAACKLKGFNVITLPCKSATWENFRRAFLNYPVQVLYVQSHGHYEIRNDDCNPSLIPQITQFLLNDTVAYSYRPQANDGSYFPEYPEPGDNAYADLGHNYGTPPWNNWPSLKAHYISEIPLDRRSNMKLVWMNCCFCGRIGAMPCYDVWNINNPFSVWGLNDMAQMFRIDENWDSGACYVGFYEKAAVDDRYANLVGVIFGSLGLGYHLDACIWRDAYNWNGGILRQNYSGYTELDGPCMVWRWPMGSYYNLRVFGRSNICYLTPM
jgi:hypothetical protein